MREVDTRKSETFYKCTIRLSVYVSYVVMEEVQIHAQPETFEENSSCNMLF